MRPFGLAVSFSCATALLVLVVLQSVRHFQHLSALSLGIGAAVNGAVAVYWLTVPSKTRAWLVGRRYAEQLLDQAADLPGNSDY